MADLRRTDSCRQAGFGCERPLWDSERRRANGGRDNDNDQEAGDNDNHPTWHQYDEVIDNNLVDDNDGIDDHHHHNPW